MINTALVVGGIAIAISLLMWAYVPTQLEGVGNPEEFEDMQEQITKNTQNINSGDNSVKTLYEAEDTLIRGEIILLREEIQDLRDRPITNNNTVVSVASDLQFDSFADITLNQQRDTFHQGDQITLRAYNEDFSDKAFLYITDPNGVTSDVARELGTNQGFFQWLHQVPEFALIGDYTLTLEIGTKVDSINITIVR